MNTGKFNSLPSDMQWAGILLFGFGIYICWDQYYWWSSRDDYSFGFLVPFFVGYVLLERWPAIQTIMQGKKRATRVGPSPTRDWIDRTLSLVGGAVFILALLSIFAGGLLRATQGPQVPASLAIAWGYCWLILTSAYLFSAETAQGTRLRPGERLNIVRLFMFPALIWLISAPLLSFLERNISLFLLEKVSSIVFFLFDLFGVPIEQDGNVLVLGVLEGGSPNRVMVEEACSGIRSLMACLFAGSFLAAVFLDRFWKKILLVGLSMIFAFLMNIVRSLFLTTWAYNYGADSIQGAVHDITGYAVLGLTSLCLLALLPIFNFRHRFMENPLDAGSEGGADSSH